MSEHKKEKVYDFSKLDTTNSKEINYIHQQDINVIFPKMEDAVPVTGTVLDEMIANLKSINSYNYFYDEIILFLSSASLSGALTFYSIEQKISNRILLLTILCIFFGALYFVRRKHKQTDVDYSTKKTLSTLEKMSELLKKEEKWI